MDQLRWLSVLLVSCVLVVGCGDDDDCPTPDAGPPDSGFDAGFDGGSDAGADAGAPTTATFAGLWRFESMSFQEGSTVTTYTRGGSPAGLIGDTVFGPTGPTSGALSVRFAILMDGVLATPPIVQTHLMTLEDARWVMRTEDALEQVFTWALVGSQLTLLWDETDPRNAAAGTDHVTEIVLTQIPFPAGLLFGRWELESMVLDGVPIAAGACVDTGPIASAEYALESRMSARFQYDQLLTVRSYSDDICAALMTTTTSRQVGLAEEVGNEVTLYLRVDGTHSDTVVFEETAGPGTLLLARTSCLPMPDCEPRSPSELRLRRPM